MASTSRRNRSEAVEEFPDVEWDDNSRILLNYILRHSANGMPIKSADLQSVIAQNKRELSGRLQLVTERLEEVYGIKLCHVEGPGNRLICYSELPNVSMHERTPQQSSRYTLLCIILTYIFMRGNRVEDEKLYRLLESINIDVNESHGYFGDNVKKLIEDTFVKQLYLKRERQQTSSYEDPKTHYSWGQRATKEFSHEQIVQFASKLFKKDPIYFNEQLKMAKGLADPELMRNESHSGDLSDDSPADRDVDITM